MQYETKKQALNNVPSDFGHNCQKKINVINKAVTIRKMYNFVSLSV